MADKKQNVNIIFRGINQVTGPIADVNKRLTAMQAPIRRLQTQLSALTRTTGLAKMSSAIGGVGSAVMGLGGQLAFTTLKFGALGFVGFHAFQRIIGGTVTTVSALDELSERTGVSVEQLQRWRFAAEQSGASTEEMDKALLKFAQNLGKLRGGTGELITLLGKDSPFIKTLTSFEDTNEAFTFFMRQLRQVPNDANRVTLALSLLGRSGAGLINVAMMTDEARQEIFAMSEEMGELNSAQTAAFRVAGDLMNEIGNRLNRIKQEVIAEIIPVVIDLSERMRSWIQENRPRIVAFANEFAQRLPNMIERTIEALKKLAAALAPIGHLIAWITENSTRMKFAIGILAAIISKSLIVSIFALTKALWGLGVALMTTPIGWFISALIPLGVAIGVIVARWAEVKSFMSDFSFLEKLGLVLGFLWDSLKNIADVMWKIMTFLPRLIGSGILDLAKTGLGAVGNLLGLGSQATGAPVMSGNAVGPAVRSVSTTNNAAVTVRFENAPKGVRFTTETSEKMPFDFSVGYALGVGD